MGIEKLSPGQETELEDFLSEFASSSMFIRSNLRTSGLEFQNEPMQGEYFCYNDGSGKISGVLVHNWNGNIMMQASKPVILTELLDCFSQQCNREIAGILGSKEQAEQLIHKLGLGEAEYSINSDQGLFALNLAQLNIPDHDYTDLILKKPDEHQFELLCEWMRDYTVEAFGMEENENNISQANTRAKNAVNGDSSWILQLKGTPISLCGFNAELPDMVQVGPVWTPPQYRNNGYARICVALALEQAARNGIKKAILFTDNHAATRAYKSIGFEKIGSFRLALLKTPAKLN